MTRNDLHRDNERASRSAGRDAAKRIAILAAALGMALAAPRAVVAQADGACSETAALAFDACRFERQDDFLRALARCENVSDEQQQDQCEVEAATARQEGLQSCRAVRGARLEVCGRLGEAPYDPDFDPALFDTDYRHLTNPNPYFPLRIGNRWHLASSTETDTLVVLNGTKLIEGVTCIRVDDKVKEGADLKESTEDWFCQAKDGTVHYFGEEVKNFESFDGDRPRVAELVNVDGSFKEGRDGSRGGTIFPANPVVGLVYREEFSLGNAEDVAEVVSTTYSYGTVPDLDRFVPRALAQRLCSAGDCVVTKNTQATEPGVVARKYYARGIGFFLDVKLSTGEATQLVSCNFDSRCVGLPRP